MIATGSKPMQLGSSFSMYFVLCVSVFSDENDIYSQHPAG